MNLDVRLDDEIVVGTEAFNLVGLERLPMATAAAFLEMMTLTIETRRAPEVDAEGKRGEAITYLTNVRSTPLLPVTGRVELRPTMQTPVQVLELYLDGTTEILHAMVERKKIYV